MTYRNRPIVSEEAWFVEPVANPRFGAVVLRVFRTKAGVCLVVPALYRILPVDRIIPEAVTACWCRSNLVLNLPDRPELWLSDSQKVWLEGDLIQSGRVPVLITDHNYRYCTQIIIAGQHHSQQ